MLTVTVDYYDVLGLLPHSAPEQVKAAYRRLAKNAHPDVAGTPELFRVLREAYEVLSDSNRRADYDRVHRGSGEVGPAPGATAKPPRTPEPHPEYVAEDWPPTRDTAPSADYVAEAWPPPHTDSGAPSRANPGGVRSLYDDPRYFDSIMIEIAERVWKGARLATPEWMLTRRRVCRAALALPLPSSAFGTIVVVTAWFVAALVAITETAAMTRSDLLAWTLVFAVVLVPTALLVLRTMLVVDAHRQARRRR